MKLSSEQTGSSHFTILIQSLSFEYKCYANNILCLQAVKDLIAVSNRHRRFLLGMLSMPSKTAGEGENGIAMENGIHTEHNLSDPWHWDQTETAHSNDR